MKRVVRSSLQLIGDVWEKEDSKTVQDFDGFFTEYTLWYNVLDDYWITIFGDSDLYDPTNTDPDMEFDTESEALEWFESYEV